MLRAKPIQSTHLSPASLLSLLVEYAKLPLGLADPRRNLSENITEVLWSVLVTPRNAGKLPGVKFYRVPKRALNGNMKRNYSSRTLSEHLGSAEQIQVD